MGCKNQKNIAAITKKITWIGLIINLVLSGIKFAAGILGSSQALIADAVHTLSDLTTDLAILFGVKYWTAPPDESHPYGHGKIETLVTAFIGIVLAAAAIGIGYEALNTIKDKHTAQPGIIALLGSLVSIVLKEVLYQWTSAVGKKISSSALVANAWHHRTDAFSSIPVALAVIIAIIFPEWSFVDHVGAFVVSLFILHTSYTILKLSFVELTDGGSSKELNAFIKTHAHKIAGVKSVHAVRTRKSGSGLLADLHILVDAQMSVQEGHDISENVKKHLLAQDLNITDVVVHIEPFLKKTPKHE